ncbi:MAG: hypothetical protein ABSF61_01495 [Anaerolineales bacterium]|jgi:hypothetical protein
MARHARLHHGPYIPTRGHFARRRFRTKQAYRDALARSKGYGSYSAERRAYRSFNTIAAIRRLSPVAQQKRADALEVLSIMRQGKSDKSAAVRQFNLMNPDRRITSRTVTKYVKPALRRSKGLWTAKPYDRLLRIMRFPTREGVIDLEVRDSRSASLIGEYWNAVAKYVATGDGRELRRFRGKSIRSGKVSWPFLIRSEALENLGDAGEFKFETIYEDVGSK